MDPINIPSWVPASVAHRVRVCERYPLTDDQHAILVRLVTDERMRDVWTKLLSQKRQSKEYCFPAILGGNGPLAKFAQEDAIGDLFLFCFSSIKDKRSTTTEKENERQRADALNKAMILREIVKDIREGNVSSSTIQNDASVLERIVDRYEVRAREQRGLGDPLTVEKHRQDPVADGATRDCLGHVKRLFRGQLPGLVASIVTVGTGMVISRDAGRRRTAAT